ncbi:MAG TPA: hypothetical protein VLU96_09380 [Gaiellaceae bacterium]|nr:hypothetical protein [Gaiellaceae bacterium]
MYDVFTSRYAFSCPERGEAHVALSSFRQIEQLAGAAHPAVYEVSFDCSCGGRHPGLVSHNELDWAPLGLREGVFLNLMTAKLDSLEDELADLAARRISAGEWPWSFFCYPEERPRPVFPSAFLLLAPADDGGTIGVAVRCPVCGSVSVNLVSAAHVDLPFHNDADIGVVEHVFAGHGERVLEEFTADLHSTRFDARRLAL